MAGPLFLGVQKCETHQPNPTGADDGAVPLLPPIPGGGGTHSVTEGLFSSPRFRGEVAAQPTEGFYLAATTVTPDLIRGLPTVSVFGPT